MLPHGVTVPNLYSTPISETGVKGSVDFNGRWFLQIALNSLDSMDGRWFLQIALNSLDSMDGNNFFYLPQ